MKKICIFLLLITTLICFSSCVDDDEELEKPYIKINRQVSVTDVDGTTKTTDTVDVTVTIDPDSSYLNIFRTEIDDFGDFLDSDEREITNIAQVYDFNSSLTSFTYTDYYLETGKRYAYCIRYYTSGVYMYTDWSTWPSTTSTTDEENTVTLDAELTTIYAENSFKYDVGNSYFEYDESEYNLTITTQDSEGNATDKIESVSLYPIDTYSTCLAVSNSEKTVAFYTGYNYVNDDGSISNNTKLNMRSLLTEDFFDCAISIDGFVFKTSSTERYGSLIQWSQLSKLDVMVEDESVETIVVALNSSTTSDGDYTPYSSVNITNSIENCASFNNPSVLDLTPFGTK